jgi:phosphate:Na+ symporter
VEWLVPDKPVEEITVIRPKYLDEELLETPSLALDRVRLEIGHMGDCFKDMLEQILPAVLGGDKETLTRIARIDDDEDILYEHVIEYLGKISRKSLTGEQPGILLGLMRAANDLETMADIIEKDLVALGRQRIDENINTSADTRHVLTTLHEMISKATELAITAAVDNDMEAATYSIGMKARIDSLVDSAARHEANRLVADEPGRLAAYTLEVDIIEKLKSIYYFAKRIAKKVAPPGEVVNTEQAA